MRTELEQRNYIDLAALQRRLKTSVESAFPDRVWVKAEIASLNRKQNGHCYLELCQSTDGTVAAKVRAMIWASRWNYIDQFFRSVTGTSLGVGIEILARVQVSYHPVYGIGLTIDEVDPDFTLGAAERRRQETIERLTKEGLMGLQKQLRLPLLPYSLAVVSAGTAAGFGDFCNHLKDNEYGFVFRVDLFEALMQGDGAPSSVRAAFDAILSSPVRYDAILILRGGGSDLDLACFDDYDLAVTIARCPVPVFTAIGHDKDHHVADMVANSFVKTPTALADLFLDCYIAEDQRLCSYESRLATAFANRVASMASRVDLLAAGIVQKAEGRLSRAEIALDRLGHGVAMRVSGRLADASSFLLRMETRIETTDPRNILKKGYALALDSRGVKLSSAASGHRGDIVRMMFADGTLKCEVVDVQRSQPGNN